MQRARLVLRRYRQERTEFVRQYVGHHWSEESTREKVPVNLLSLYVSVVGRSLIAKNPRVMMSTFDPGMKPRVSIMETWANKEMGRMRLANTLQRVVLDGLFSVGICKVALATPADAATFLWNQRAGQPFAERVDLDDWVFDVHARDFNECAFIGHRYRAPIDVIKDSKYYGKSRKTLEPTEDRLYNVEGDERIGVLGRGTYAGDWEEFDSFVDLWEVYLPRHRLVLTLRDDDLTGAATDAAVNGKADPLRSQRWLGPDCGPYHILAFGTVPGNAMPKAPIMDLMDLHEAANTLYRKLIRQGERMKEVTFVQGGAMEDGKRVMEGNDGDILRVDNPESLKQVRMGMPDPTVFQLAETLRSVFSDLAGNLELLGGRGPQSKTATQDEMLNQNASAGVADLQQQTVNFTSDVIRSLCWYFWHDPQKVMRVKHALPGLPDMHIIRYLHPAGAVDQQGRPQQMQRQGNFDNDIDVEIDPYSMQHSTPQARMAALNQVVTQIFMPMAQMAQQQGISLDFHKLLEKAAKYLDMPDLQEILTFAQPPMQDPQMAGGGQDQAGPANTTRTYNRVSMPGRTPQGDQQNRLNALAGVNPGGNPEKTRNGPPMSLNGR